MNTPFGVFMDDEPFRLRIWPLMVRSVALATRLES
ncbi:hypothetical protein ACVILH_000443 [Bradyrhizobium sp. USDA 4353]